MRRKNLDQQESEESTRSLPKSGDVFRCESCGMELEIIADCGCDEGPRLECCGQPMSRADDAGGI